MKQRENLPFWKNVLTINENAINDMPYTRKNTNTNEGCEFVKTDTPPILIAMKIAKNILVRIMYTNENRNHDNQYIDTFIPINFIDSWVTKKREFLFL